GHKVFSIKDGGTLEIPEAGDFVSDAGFTASMWIRIPRRNVTGAVVARMDNTQAHRGWDVWVEGDRVGMHIIHSWPDNAMKVLAKPQLKPNEWTHVTIAYDGSRKAAGVKVYFNGLPQATDILADKLKTETIRTEVPLKV